MCGEPKIVDKKIMKPSNRRCSSYKSIFFLICICYKFIIRESNYNFLVGTHIRPVHSYPSLESVLITEFVLVAAPCLGIHQ